MSSLFWQAILSYPKGNPVFGTDEIRSRSPLCAGSLVCHGAVDLRGYEHSFGFGAMTRSFLVPVQSVARSRILFVF